MAMYVSLLVQTAWYFAFQSKWNTCQGHDGYQAFQKDFSYFNLQYFTNEKNNNNYALYLFLKQFVYIKDICKHLKTPRVI